MKPSEGVGSEGNGEQVFGSKPMGDADLPDYDDDLVRRLASLPQADASPRRNGVPAEWDCERWDGMA